MVLIVLFGPPGAGKGTLAGRIEEFSPLVHISTGDLFRFNIKNNTPLGQEAKGYIDAGKLVPDAVTINMVKERISQADVVERGALLDGFPRTLAQAQALDEIAKVDSVAVINISKEELKPRIVNRRNCTQCGRDYNLVYAPKAPKQAGHCDADQAALEQRHDDTEEAFEKRWVTYKAQSEAVIEYYKQQGKVQDFNGAEVFTMSAKTIAEKLRIG